MSDLKSALPGAEFDGIVHVAEAGLKGMITLKADLAGAKTALKSVTGQALPGVREIAEGDISVAWMAPDELLILCDHAKADAVVAALSAKLKKKHHLVVNVSDARAVFTLRGAAIRDTLAKLAPADMAALPVGEMRRTRLAQIPAAIWLSDEHTATVICFRSVAQYAFDLLKTAAQPGGEVHYS